jgi:hypothetical protein
VTAPPGPYVPFYALRRHRLLTRSGVYGYKPITGFDPRYMAAHIPGLALVADAAWLHRVYRSLAWETDLWVAAPDGGAHRLLSGGTCSVLPTVPDVWGRAGTYVVGLEVTRRAMAAAVDPSRPRLLIERVVPRGRAWPILYSEAYPLEVLLNCLAAEPAGRELPPRRSRWSSWITRFRPW